MRRAILLALLAVMTRNALAEWIEIGAVGKNGTAYIDSATIRKTGNISKMWHLIDFKSMQGLDTNKPHMSVKSQFEYDCNEQRWRLLNSTIHSKNMGGGDIVNSDSDPTEWSPIPLGTGGNSIWNVVCGNR